MSRQRSGFGIMVRRDFYTGTVSARSAGIHGHHSLRQPSIAALSRASGEHDYHEAATAQGGDRIRLSPDHHRTRPEGVARSCGVIKERLHSFKIYMTSTP